MNEYQQFLASKTASAPRAGFDVDPAHIHPSLFPFQRAVVRWCLAQGRSALFEDTGLGKSRQIVEWMRHVHNHTGERVLLVVPLAVAHQFVRDEAPAIGQHLAYCRNQREVDATAAPLIVTNYEMARHFDARQYAGVALDEADILSNMVGATNKLLSAMFAATPFKLTATATPAPNDLIELGRYAQFLGVMDSGEMLTRFFIRDSQNAVNLRLRHWAAAGPFWDWLTSWAVCIGVPSDYGDYADDGYVLPPLTIEEHTVAVDYGRALDQGKLFPDARQSATALWATKHETHAARCELAAELVARKTGEPWVVWCSTDEESKLLCQLIPGAVEVRGSHTPEQKEQRLRNFSEGRSRVIVTKPKIAGMGLNWQHCADMVYVSPTFSFKYFYQGLRRIYRFRQTRPVTCHVVIAETEENVIAAVQRKQEQHRQLHTQARAATRRRAALTDDWRVATTDYQSMPLPQWLQGA